MRLCAIHSGNAVPCCLYPTTWQCVVLVCRRLCVTLAVVGASGCVPYSNGFGSYWQLCTSSSRRLVTGRGLPTMVVQSPRFTCYMIHMLRELHELCTSGHEASMYTACCTCIIQCMCIVHGCSLACTLLAQALNVHCTCLCMHCMCVVHACDWPHRAFVTALKDCMIIQYVLQCNDAELGYR